MYAFEQQRLTTPRVTHILTSKPLMGKPKRGNCSYVVILYNPKDVKQAFVLGNKNPYDIFSKINTTLSVVRELKGFTDKSAYNIINPGLPYLSSTLCAFLASVQHRQLKAVIVARYHSFKNRGVRAMHKQRLNAFIAKMEDERYANEINVAAIATV